MSPSKPYIYKERERGAFKFANKKKGSALNFSIYKEHLNKLEITIEEGYFMNFKTGTITNSIEFPRNSIKN